jgi:hypothetical protein
MSILDVLIRVTSLVLRSPISLKIHNQSKDIHLTSPVNFIRGGEWHAVPDQGIDVNAIMRNCIELDYGQGILEGALIYKIQRKDTVSDQSSQNESKYTQLLVAWRVEHTKELVVRGLLVEHDGKLDEDKLRQLYQKCWHLFDTWVDPIKNGWLLNDGKELKTEVKAMNGGYRWDISISEEVEYDDKRPLWIDTTK